jgi:hypothetical protein
MPEPSVWDEDTFTMVHGAPIATVTGTADATYSANEVTLINDLATAVNAILVVLRSAGMLAKD